MHRDLDRVGGQYRDEGAFGELDNLSLDALGAIERAWRAVCGVTDGHEAQLCEADAAQPLDDDDQHEDQNGDTPGGDGGPMPPYQGREK